MGFGARSYELGLHELAARLSPEQIQVGIDDYLKIATLLDDGLTTQARLDVDSLERHIRRTFTAAEPEEITSAQYGHRMLASVVTAEFAGVDIVSSYS